LNVCQMLGRVPCVAFIRACFIACSSRDSGIKQVT
jgi:hypothetical protein